MRRGKEFYDKNYSKVMELHKQGLSVKEIASRLNISYSAVYHWVRGLRKPTAGNVTEFLQHLKEKGPVPAAEIKKKFPKHNELFLISAKRREPIKRYVLGRKFGEYGTWYFLEGQEELLQKRVKNMLGVLKEASSRLKEFNI